MYSLGSIMFVVSEKKIIFPFSPMLKARSCNCNLHSHNTLKYLHSNIWLQLVKQSLRSRSLNYYPISETLIEADQPQLIFNSLKSNNTVHTLSRSFQHSPHIVMVISTQSTHCHGHFSQVWFNSFQCLSRRRLKYKMCEYYKYFIYRKTPQDLY